MPTWYRSSPPGTGSSSTKWTPDDVAMPTLTKKNIRDSGSTAPTSGDTDLPLPVQQSVSYADHRRLNQKFELGTAIRDVWATFRKRIGTGTAPSNGTDHADNHEDANPSLHISEGVDLKHPEVDQVVVDRTWTAEAKDSSTGSEYEMSPDKSGATPPVPGSAVPEQESAVVTHGHWSLPWIIIRYRFWPAVLNFFYPTSYINEDGERHYKQEDWFLNKNLALWASLWLVANWALGCGFVPKPFQLADNIFYFGVAPAFSLPVGVMVMYDWPRDRPKMYQAFLMVSIWMWSFYQILYIWLCGFYNPASSHFACSGPNAPARDFLGTFYYTTALQTIALFGLKLDRLPAAFAATTFFIFTSATIIPEKLTWARTMINFAVFHIFLLYVHYMRENAERRLYNLRNQVRIQYKAAQRAQVNERKIADSKYRLTSYVRVPLNSALLAVQNMEASGTVVKDMEIEFSALLGSLSMMSKVLNDVLDFNRMDSGRFESVAKPYVFHQAMRSMFIPLQLTTNARGLKFITKLDPNIDRVARRAAYRAMGENEATIVKHISEYPNVDGVVIGDEARLRQIVTNLASNACKFTPEGGTLTITTRLVLPQVNAEGSELVDEEEQLEVSVPLTESQKHQLSASHLTQHNRQLREQEKCASSPSIIVRIEVEDTGYGIESHELVHSKLFSAFNQTEQGRQQGGKGTGLGLALVRNIVKLSGGRLGVKSVKGVGSTFWVELPLGVGRHTLIPHGPPESESDASSRTDLAKVRNAARQNSAIESLSKDGLAMAVDAAALKASQMSAVASNSSLAMHSSLMEQAGRVELVVPTHVLGTTPPVSPPISMSDVSSPPSPSTGYMDSRIHTPQPRRSVDASSETPVVSLSSKRPSVIPRQTSSSGEPATYHKMKAIRPTNVPLPPSTSNFGLDPHPTTSTNFSSISASSNPMTVFDRAFNMGGSSSTIDPADDLTPGLPVLVVDDDPITRKLMKRLLERLGCEVSLAENGKIALQMILGPDWTPVNQADGWLTFVPNQPNVSGGTQDREGGASGSTEKRSPTSENGCAGSSSPYSVVFLDNQMPVLSGLKSVKILRDLGRKDFVVGLTGNALLPDQKEYVDAGVDIVLTKPVLERSVKDVLRQADSRRRRRSRTALGQDHPS